MASDSNFEGLWKGLLVYAPELPTPLAQKFVNKAYSRILNQAILPNTFRESAFVVPAQYATGTLAVTNGSTNVVGTGTTWTSDMVGRQLIVNNRGPFLDISTVNSATSITTVQPFIGTDFSGAYTIALVYIPMPSDFMSFRSVVDVVNNWKVWTDFTQEQIDVLDARRIVSGTPWLMAVCRPSAPGTVNELVRYELWPRRTGGQTYPFKYIPKLALMSAPSDRPVFPVRGDIILEGALAECAIWPGTKDAPNPYYDIQLHRTHEARFWKGLYDLEREVQMTAQSWISYGDTSLPYAPLDAAYLQAHGIQF